MLDLYALLRSAAPFVSRLRREPPRIKSGAGSPPHSLREWVEDQCSEIPYYRERDSHSEARWAASMARGALGGPANSRAVIGSTCSWEASQWIVGLGVVA